jgi:peptidoglycan/LPS O-acetylase OafA/YrhL
MDPTAEQHIKTLDGMRAVAILLVIFSHVLESVGSHSAWTRAGYIGVTIFFALSGYLITTRLVQEYEKTGRVSLRNFYIRRAFRILPSAVLFLTLLWVLVQLGVAVCDGSVIRSALLFYTNYIDVNYITGWRAGHFWSLSVEEHFYLFWPCLLIGFGVRRGWITAAVAAAGVCVWRAVDLHHHIIDRLFNAPYLYNQEVRTDLIADTLLWGCCFAFLRLGKVRSVVSTIATVGLMVILGLYTMPGEYRAAIHLLPRDIDYLEVLLHILPGLILVAVVSSPRAPIGRFLEWAPMRFIGHLSYSLYIWQQLFLGGPGPRLPLPLAVCSAFACAYLSYRFIEKPFIRLGRSIVDRSVASANHAPVSL